jgi:hypothetical protein
MSRDLTPVLPSKLVDADGAVRHVARLLLIHARDAGILPRDAGQVRYVSRRCRMEWISTVCLPSLMR